MEGDSDLLLGIDVGTSSARAGLFDTSGRCISIGIAPFETFHPETDYYEQSSDEIWQAVCKATRQALEEASDDVQVLTQRIVGIGFDATCSLVALDELGKSVTVSKSGDDRWNVIVWMDHRAKAEAEEINALVDSSEEVKRVLNHYGGKIFVENEPPKLLWIKRNLPKSWHRAGKWMDLCDYLSFRATGNEVRSLCSTACKWARIDPEQWSEEFFCSIGLGELVEEKSRRIGSRVARPGEAIPGGLTDDAALELGGLCPGMAVAVSMVDAHAGGIGLLGAETSNIPSNLCQRLALICGTSTCHMAISSSKIFVPRVWGPFQDAMIPGFWLTEGGQSATGSLLDSIIQRSCHYSSLLAEARESKTSVHAILGDRFEAMLKRVENVSVHPTFSLHVLPYFHGNRHPRADPSLMGVISGLSLTHNLDDLTRLYGATLESTIYGARHLLESMNTAGHDIQYLFVCGGISKSNIFLSTLADATGLTVVLPAEAEAVLLGSAILGAAAAGKCERDLVKNMKRMSQVGRVIEPIPGNRDFHDRKYRVFLKMYEHFLEVRSIMNGRSAEDDC